MNELPPGWEWTTLGDTCDVVGGATPKTAVDQYWGGPVPWVTPDDLSRHRGRGISCGARSLTEEGFRSASVTMLPVGTVLFSSRAPIGYVAIAEVPLCTNQGFKSVVPPSGLSSNYLYWYLRHATPLIDSMASGTTFKEISKRRMQEVPLPIPPAAEQERIVAAIEEHLSRLDAAEALLGQAAAKLRALRSASQRSLLPEPDRSLAGVATVSAGATPPRVGDLPDQGDWPFYKVGDMNAAEGRWMGKSRTYVVEGSDAARRLRRWPAGTVIFPKQGGAIATNKKRQLGEPAYCDLNTMGVLPGPDLDPGYLFRVLEQVDLTDLSDGSVVQQIKKPAIEALPIGVPDREIQNQIAAQIDEVEVVLDRLQVSLQSATRRSAVLRRAVLAAAFSGHLVPQDPDDEPASVLLDRIRAERAAAVPRKRTRKAKAS